MRVSVRIPTHLDPTRGASRKPSEEEEPQFVNRPCYVFNPRLDHLQDDRRCSHCRHYLTAACPHIDEFLDEVDDLSPD